MIKPLVPCVVCNADCTLRHALFLVFHDILPDFNIASHVLFLFSIPFIQSIKEMLKPSLDI